MSNLRQPKINVRVMDGSGDIDIEDETGFASVHLPADREKASVFIGPQCVISGIHRSFALRRLAEILMFAADYMDGAGDEFKSGS